MAVWLTSCVCGTYWNELRGCHLPCSALRVGVSHDLRGWHLPTSTWVAPTYPIRAVWMAHTDCTIYLGGTYLPSLYTSPPVGLSDRSESLIASCALQNAETPCQLVWQELKFCRLKIRFHLSVAVWLTSCVCGTYRNELRGWHLPYSALRVRVSHNLRGWHLPTAAKDLRGWHLPPQLRGWHLPTLLFNLRNR